MQLLDIVSSGNVVIITTPAQDKSGKSIIRMDFVSTKKGSPGKVADAIGAKLTGVGFSNSTLAFEKTDTTGFKFLNLRPDDVRPYDFDRKELSEVSKVITDTADVYGMSTLYLSAEFVALLTSDYANIATFVRSDDSVTVSHPDAVSLSVRKKQGGFDSSIRSVTLERLDDASVKDAIPVYGEVRPSHDRSFLVMYNYKETTSPRKQAPPEVKATVEDIIKMQSMNDEGKVLTREDRNAEKGKGTIGKMATVALTAGALLLTHNEGAKKKNAGSRNFPSLPMRREPDSDVSSAVAGDVAKRLL